MSNFKIWKKVLEKCDRKNHLDHNGHKNVSSVEKVVTINFFVPFFKLEFFETKVKQMKQK
jgi:hypothetical protein